MKSWYKNLFLRGVASAISLLGLTLIAIPETSPASASTGTSISLSVPPVPAAGSSMATWQSWASAQQKAMESVDPLAIATSTPGCTTISATLEPVVSTGSAGIPAGIVTDAVVLVGSCTANSTRSPSIGGIIPLISSYCPGMNGCNYSSATNGYVAVGTYTYGGNSAYMAAAYTYTASGSGYSAHSELGTVSSGCATGSLVANSSSVSLSTGQYVEVIWGPRTGSSTWSGTGWHYNGSSYVDLGTVCGMW